MVTDEAPIFDMKIVVRKEFLTVSGVKPGCLNISLSDYLQKPRPIILFSIIKNSRNDIWL